MSPATVTPANPEQRARREIDAALVAAGWAVQSRDEINLAASRGVAIREFILPGYGTADYLLFVDGKAVGALEAKKLGFPLASFEVQGERYSKGLPATLTAPIRPLPFVYLSTGAETGFINQLDPKPRTRRVFSFHQPETLAEWIAADSLAKWAAGDPGGASIVADALPSTLRARLQTMPPVLIPNLWQNKVQAIQNLEGSLAKGHPRALIQMATGAGKTLLAITSLYRLIKFGGARRVLFLVDRTNLGEQAEKEFQNYRTPDDNRKFTELYPVQRLTTNTIAASSKVVITTIQRLYSMLKGEPDLPPEVEEESEFSHDEDAAKGALPVVYNAAIPPEYFDFIVIDECHRSIYSLWRQVLEYFDAYLVGLTATPAQHTYGFFNQNLVMEYPHERAVADGVNVDFEVYRIRTKITEQGATIDASEFPVVGMRDRRTRKTRWQAPDAPFTYDSKDLDRSVVAKDQIRLIARTFKEKVFTDLFPDRAASARARGQQPVVPKTLIFAKDDSHAEDIVDIVRHEFGEGNEFCRKITYRTTGAKPADLIQDFRNSFHPRIAVTVDMIATGTDIRPVEIVMFMRSVHSRVLFEQMKGRGVRVIDKNELRAVTPDAINGKTHFVIVDCVGITESELVDTQPLDKKKGVSFKKLLDDVALGSTDPEVLSSLASRLARLDKQCGPDERARIQAVAPAADLEAITTAIVSALDADRQDEAARATFGLAPHQEPSEAQVKEVRTALLREAAKPLAEAPALRGVLLDLKRQFEQVIDEVSKDVLLGAGASAEAREKARALTKDFEQFLADHRDEIDALQFFYSQTYGKRLRFKDIQALAQAMQAPDRAWTPERLWRAYEILDRDRVRGVSAQRLLTDIVSLVRFALHRDSDLVPYAEQVRERFAGWMAQQQNRGRRFTEEQVRWLEMICDHVATSLEIDIQDFDYSPFAGEGGLGRARRVFGDELRPILDELNEALAA
jgi:type I restriction enzyme R subunit